MRKLIYSTLSLMAIALLGTSCSETEEQKWFPKRGQKHK